ncbi:MAG: peptidoglycan DD-metalloendopeptidase family protein [candidate division WWE3 bacterium]|nr:peptidoglycan DD-metalloendopeptidase family protein [candidate division WWE3 bacterium]
MRKILPVLVTSLVIILALSGKSFATATTDPQQILDITKPKLVQSQQQERTLKGELAVIDAKMVDTQAKIAQGAANIKLKTEELVVIGTDINSLQIKIGRLSDSLSTQQNAFEARLTAQYKISSTSPFLELFISGGSFSDFVSKIEYLKTAELNDQLLITQMSSSRQSYQDQTTLLNQKKADALVVKAEIEASQRQQIANQTQLISQKADRDQLLKDTQNDELKYQQIIDQAQSELAAINGTFAGADYSQAKPVKQGDPIAIMGNTGSPSCSTGAHLHFEVHKNGVLQNAEDYLNSYSFEGTTIGSGSWPWPMKDPYITQRFGHTPYSYRYVNGIHTFGKNVRNFLQLQSFISA